MTHEDLPYISFSISDRSQVLQLPCLPLSHCFVLSNRISDSPCPAPACFPLYIRSLSVLHPFTGFLLDAVVFTLDSLNT
jgi:hypothetical protein